MKSNLLLSIITILLIGSILDLKGQDLLIKRASRPNTIDGVMDEGAWEKGM